MWTVFRKDLLIEWRGRNVSQAMLIFSGIVGMVLGMAFEPLAGYTRAVSGVLWVLITFAIIHGLNRSFDDEFADDGLQGLMLTGVDPAAIYAGKILSNTIFLFVVFVGAVVLVTVFFNTPVMLSVLPRLVVLMALAALGLTGVGGLLTVMARHSRLGETLLPVMFLPLTVPVLLAGVEAVPILLETGALDRSWLRILLLYNGGMLTAAAVGFEYVFDG